MQFTTVLLFILVGAVQTVFISTARASDAAQLTLDSAVHEGLGRSPDIQRSRAVESESEWHHFEMLGAGFLPKVTVSAQHYFDEKYTYTNIDFSGAFFNFPGFYPTNQGALDVSIPLFDGLANLRNLQAASLQEDAAKAQLSHDEFTLKKQIQLQFYKCLAAKELETVAEQNVRTLDDHLKQVDARKHGGAATTYDVLRVQVQLNEAKADAIDAQDAYETARRKLTELLGLDRDDRGLVGSLPLPDAGRVKNLTFDENSDQRADIRALNLRAAAADRTREASLSWLVPSISVGGEYMIYDAQLFQNSVQDTGNYYNSYNVGLFLKWNLFDGGVSIARQQEAAQRSEQAEQAARAAKLQVPYDFDYWKRRYLSNTDHFISKRFDITRSEESVRLAKIEERAGTRTSTETLDAELDLFRAKAGVVNALVNAAEAEIRLEMALGREI